MSAFNSAAFWPAAKAAGMLKEATTVLPGDVAATPFDVDWRRPDVNPLTGTQSADYEIHYQYADAPTLKEGAEVIVDAVLYRVRAEPFIDPARGDGGFWRSAFLTRVATACEP